MNQNEEEDVFYEILEGSQMVTIQSVMRENKDLKHIIATVKAENQKLREEVRTAKEDNQIVGMNLLRKKEELEGALSKLKQFSKITVKLAQDKMHFQEILVKNKGKIGDLQSKCQGLVEDIQRLKQKSAGEYKLLLDELNEVKSRLAKQAEERLKGQQHCKELKEKVNARIRDCNNLYQTMQSMKAKIKQQKDQNNKNQQQIKSYQNKLEQMSGEKIDLQLKIITLKSELFEHKLEENTEKGKKQRQA